MEGVPLSSTSTPACSLRHVDNRQDGQQQHLDIVLIPGVDTPVVETWPFQSTSWLSENLHLHDTLLLIFDYCIPRTDQFSWKLFLIYGDALLNVLDAARPWFCVCHSLGGLILKQALCIANEQIYHYGSFINSLAGIIFLGTPHAAANDLETFLKYQAILKGTAKKSIDHMLSRLTARFEGMYIRTPMLSITESKETRIRRGRILRKMQLLTDKALCETHAPMERNLCLPLEHARLCHFDDVTSESRLSIYYFISQTLENVDAIISDRLHAMEFQYAAMTSYSPTESELLEEERRRESVHATEGSSQLKRLLSLPCIILDSYSPNRVFYLREDILQKISEALLPQEVEGTSKLGLRQFTLCGMGGMGKTEIALEFTLRNKSFFDAVFWVRADETSKLDDSYQEISLRLGLEDPSECKSHVVTRSLVKGWLSTPQKKVPASLGDDESTASSLDEAKWLIVFDNADNPQILGDYWPMGTGSVLITSRDPIAKRLFTAKASGIDLGPLSDEDGGTLLMKLTAVDDGIEDGAKSLARCISRQLGGLPLAISQMAGIIQRQDLSLSEFLALYEDEKEHPGLHSTRFDLSNNTYTYNIATSRGLLKIMSLMDPDNIQENILYEAATQLSPDYTYTNKVYRAARTELLQSSLTKRDKQLNELSEHRLSMHRLVQDVVRAKMAPQEIMNIFGILVVCLWVSWPSAMPKPSKPLCINLPKASNKRLEVSRWPLCAALYPHIVSLKQVWPQVPPSSTSTKLHFAALLNDGAWYQSERGQTRHFDGFFELAQSICRDLEGDDRDAILSDIHFCLGAIAADTNNHETSRLHKEESFRLQKSISDSLGTVDDRLALCYSELAISRIQDGRLEEGVAALLREKEIRISLGTYVPLSREANLGLVYMLQGKLDAAEFILRESLITRERLYGKNDKESFRTGRIFYALGNLRSLQGRDNEAYSCHKQAYQQFRDTIGIHHHHRTADVGHKVAEHLIRFGKHDEAISMINDALQAWSYDANVYKPELARTTFLKATALYQIGRTSKANVVIKVACRLRRELLPDACNDATNLSMDDFDELVSFWSR
ncbi:tetratricopeptide repeat domain-containing protein [Aspergillus avenaceus]|uniref:Tetratricopeptide repeat domain-containing protein n=1 Tax=Aspergillus avenaceus TaxID=36643 RepID=A0A5N6TUJ0_ASPAV|nr:tetratricopeptide repeat domain-containing protein [Aspergillus avenaceus]